MASVNPSSSLYWFLVGLAQFFVINVGRSTYIFLEEKNSSAKLILDFKHKKERKRKNNKKASE